MMMMMIQVFEETSICTIWNLADYSSNDQGKVASLQLEIEEMTKKVILWYSG